METGARVTVTCGLGGLRRGETAEASNDISAMKDAGIDYVYQTVSSVSCVCDPVLCYYRDYCERDPVIISFLICVLLNDIFAVYV